jgi:flagellar biosynthesis/type III secretory pathway protein FliH
MQEPAKRAIEEELKKVYKVDRFLDGNPYVEERVERSHARGLEEGRTEGMQQLMPGVIKDRFPALADQAQLQIEQIHDTDALQTLF